MVAVLMESDIHMLLGELKAKVDLILDRQEEHNEKTDKLEDRVQRVESRINRAAGVVAAVVMIVTLSFDHVINYFTGKA
jgi:hypothetical protein